MLFNRIEIIYKDGFKDGREHGLIEVIKEDAGLELDKVKIVAVYNLFDEFTEKELSLLKDELFCDAVCQKGALGFHYATELDFDFCIEISYLPGVTDNVGRTAASGIEHILNRKIKDTNVRSSFLYLFNGKINKQDMKSIARKVLCNTLIEKYFIFTKEEINSGKSVIYELPEETSISPPYFHEINLEISDKELEKLSDKAVLSLSLEEMKAIRDHYRNEDIRKTRKLKGLPDNPTDVELEVFAQTWSEHCKHKIFSANIEYKDNDKTQNISSLFKTFIQNSAEELKKNRNDLLSLFKDNAGVVKFNEDYAYCVKVETHNSPSALDPYGGAMTGIVGVNRDILGTGMGAYPIFNTDIFCFGDPFTDNKKIDKNLLHPRRIFRGVHRGIKDGGNESGIPTVNGSITFDDSFLGKPLVFCGTGGIMPINVNGRKCYEKHVQPGDLIVMSGGRIGKDGIHGATFSSAHLTEESPTSAVQIGDPITQKKMVDFIIEARDMNLYSGLTDNGAGGLSSSVGEMANFTGGAILDLDKCPLKYSGLQPWEILVSEAQERMTIAVPKNKIDEFLNLSKRRDVESTVIGEFNTSGYFECKYNGKMISSLDMGMLHDGVPKMNLKAEWKETDQERLKEINNDYKGSLRGLLKSSNIASKEYWVRMYDHEVGARTVGKPFCGKENDGPADGAVLKVFPDSNEGLVVTHGLVPRYSEIDSYQMAANAIDEAVRSAVILGVSPDKLVGLDNFCWPDPVESKHTPDGKYKLAQLVRACHAVYDLTVEYNCPCISGKDSMKNDYRKGDKKISVLPTLLFTAIGKIDDISKMTSHYFKHENSKIYLLGETRPELGSSEYYKLKDKTGGIVPTVNPDSAKGLYRKVHETIEKGLLLSAHDLSDGGLIVALAESAFSGMIGVEIDIDSLGDNLSKEEKLFSETPSRIIVSVDSSKEQEFLDILNGQSVFCIGKTIKEKKITVRSDNKIILEDDLNELKHIWKNALVF